MITDKIPASIALEELCSKLRNAYDEVKPKGKNSLSLDYSRTKIIISKKKKGYDVSPSVPSYIYWVILAILVIVQIIIKNPFTGNPHYTVSQIGGFVGFAIVPAFFLYWVIAEVFVASKKKVIQAFCDSLHF